MTLINKTTNGQLHVCPCHKTYHLEFGNLFFQLSQDELLHLKEYLASIDYMHYLNRNKNNKNNRKLLLSIGNKNIFFSLHLYEFLELKTLLSLNSKTNKTPHVEFTTFDFIYN